MQATASENKPAANPAGILLRQWRDIRGKTQMDLSFDAGVSQKHISFVESGRSVPSRQMVLDLAQALDVPLRERNALLIAAGYAPFYSDQALDAPVMNSISKALQRMLRQHEPFPAIVMDRYWNVLMTNEAAPLLFNCFIDMAARPSPRNLLHLMFDPAGMRPFVANWPDRHAHCLLACVGKRLGASSTKGRRRCLRNCRISRCEAGVAGAIAYRRHADDPLHLRQRRHDLELFLDDRDGRDAADGHGRGAAARMHVPGRRCDRGRARAVHRCEFPACLDPALRRSAGPPRLRGKTGGRVSQGRPNSEALGPLEADLLSPGSIAGPALARY